LNGGKKNFGKLIDLTGRGKEEGTWDEIEKKGSKGNWREEGKLPEEA